MEKQISEYDLYGLRLLAFNETEPQSNQYRQVILTEEQFKAFSDAVCTVHGREGDKETVSLQMSEEIYTLPDLQEIYPTNKT